MTGSSIPRAKRIIVNKGGEITSYDKKAFLFRETQFITARQGYLDASMCIKALNTTLKETPRTQQRQEVGEENPNRKVNIVFNPNATRKPGQVLKLHVTYKEATTPRKPNDPPNWGWIDPPSPPRDAGKITENARRQSIELVRNMPKILIREFSVDKEGRDTGRVSEVEVKSLGPTINQILPGDKINLRRARSLGIVIDADGKMRCPPGTPNANQFTDIDMSNCFVVGISELRQQFRRAKNWWKGVQDEVDAIINARTAEERHQKAKENYTTEDRNKEILEEKSTKLREAFEQLGIDVSAYSDEDLSNNVHLYAALDELMKNHNGPEFRTLIEDVNNYLPPDAHIFWDDTKTVAENMSTYRKALESLYIQFLPDSVIAALEDIDPNTGQPNNPSEYAKAKEIVNTMVNRHMAIQSGFLKSQLVSWREYPEIFETMREISFVPNGISPDNMTLEGETIPLPDIDKRTGKARLGTRIEFNTFAMTLTPILDLRSLASDGSIRIEIDAVAQDGSSLPESKKLQTILDTIQRSVEAEYFINHIGYANEQSSARASSLTGMTAHEARAMHVGFHEFSHSLQYAEAQNKIIDFVGKHGSFVTIDGDGNVEVLGADWTKWSNDEWHRAMNTMMMNPFGSPDIDYPPIDINWFENSMLHLLTGDYYQNEVENYWRYVTEGKSTEELRRQISLILQEARAELFSLRAMGVIEGPEIDRILAGMDTATRPPGVGVPRRPKFRPPGRPGSGGSPGMDVPEAPDIPGVPTPPPAPETPGGGDPPIPGTPGEPGIPTTYPDPLDWEQAPTPGDLWERTAGHISRDITTGWGLVGSRPGARGETRASVKALLENVWGEALPGQNTRYEDMTPEQLDERFLFLRGEKERLSSLETLDKNEQAQLWLAIAGMEQVMNQNTTRVKLSARQRERFESEGKQIRPGRFMKQTSQVYGEKWTAQLDKALERHRAEYGDTEGVDFDEMVHWKRDIGRHAGEYGGVDGYVPSRFDGTVTPGRSIDDIRENAPEYDWSFTSRPPGTPGPTPLTDPKMWGRARRDEILGSAPPEVRTLFGGTIPPDKRRSVQSMNKKGMSRAIEESAAARDAMERMGRGSAAPGPDRQSRLLDDEMRDAVIPAITHVNSYSFDEDAEAILAIELPADYELIAGEKIIESGFTRAQLLSAEDAENLSLGSTSRYKRIRLHIPSGSRGVIDSNRHNGDSDGVLLPPGAIAIKHVGEDGIIDAVIASQETPAETFDRMLNSVEADPSDVPGVAAEKTRIRTLLSGELTKLATTESSSPSRGMRSRGRSGEPLEERRNLERNATIDSAFSRTTSRPFNSDRRYVSMLSRNNDDESPIFGKVQTRESVVASSANERIAMLSSLSRVIGDDRAELLNDPEMQRYLSNPQLVRAIQTMDPEEMNTLIEESLIDFHQGFDDRVRIPVTNQQFSGLFSSGSLETLDESPLRRDYERMIGFAPSLDSRARPQYGYMVHADHVGVTQDYLDSIDGPPGIVRSADFFSEYGDIQPMGDVRSGGRSIDIVLKPEVAARSAYTRGSGISSGRYPVPLLSNDPQSVSAAMTTGRGSLSDRDKKLNTLDLLERSLSKNFNGFASEASKTESSSLTRPGDSFEAVVAGGVKLNDVGELRFPISAIDATPEDLDLSRYISRPTRDSLANMGFSTDEIDEYISQIQSGEIPIPVGEMIKNHRKAKRFVNDFVKREDFDGRLVVTNPDGIDLLDRNTFAQYPGVIDSDDMDTVLEKRLSADLLLAAPKAIREIRKSDETMARIRRKRNQQNRGSGQQVATPIQEPAGSRVLPRSEIEPDVEDALDDIMRPRSATIASRGTQSNTRSNTAGMRSSGRGAQDARASNRAGNREDFAYEMRGLLDETFVTDEADRELIERVIASPEQDPLPTLSDEELRTLDSLMSARASRGWPSSRAARRRIRREIDNRDTAAARPSRERSGMASRGETSRIGDSGGTRQYGSYTLNEPENPPINDDDYPEGVSAAAKAQRQKVAEIEPEITETMIDLSDEHGGQMVGLDHRLKTDKSLARKIAAEKDDEFDGDAEKAAQSMSDVVRYTMAFDPEQYVGSVSAVIRDLQERGYTLRVKNYWQGGDPYQGINVAAIHPNGTRFELQFHTPQSVAEKESTHQLYELYRIEVNPRRRYQLYDSMVRLATRISLPIPPDELLEIGTLKQQPFSIKSLIDLLTSQAS